MAKNVDVKKYRCMNYGVCEKADNNIIIEIDAIEALNGTPPCPCCKQNTLEEIPEKKGVDIKKVLIACGGVAVLAGGIVLATMFSGDKTQETPSVGADSVVTKTSEKDTLAATPVAEEPQTEVKEQSGSKPEKSEQAAVKEQKTSSPKTASWASYATFDGTTMTFKKAHVIPGTSKIAQPGDRVSGAWVDGEVNHVRWYHADDSPSEVLSHE